MNGTRFGRLTVIGQCIENVNGRRAFNCVCDCGNKCIRPADQLRRFESRGIRQSCGCWKNELAADRRRKAKTHGLTTDYTKHPKLYDVWRQMLQRCENSKHKDFPDYGGRGITVCNKWHDPHAFVEWCVNSGYEEGLTIERINVNGHYRPSNCTWIPNPMQARNRRKTRVISFDGRTMCIAEWSQHLGIHIQTLLRRFRAGWSTERTLTTKPVRGSNQFSRL